LWWVSVFPIGDALVVVTSGNDDQIKGGVWREVIAAHARLRAEGLAQRLQQPVQAAGVRPGRMSP
jgi:hypothetical protein